MKNWYLQPVSNVHFVLFSETQIGNEDIFETTSKTRTFICFLHSALSTPNTKSPPQQIYPREKVSPNLTWHKTLSSQQFCWNSISTARANDGEENIKLIASHQFPLINRRKKTEKVDAKQFFYYSRYFSTFYDSFLRLFFGVTGSIKSNHHLKTKKNEKKTFLIKILVYKSSNRAQSSRVSKLKLFKYFLRDSSKSPDDHSTKHKKRIWIFSHQTCVSGLKTEPEKKPVRPNNIKKITRMCFSSLWCLSSRICF